MKVRFYRGPWDRKTALVRDTEDIVVVASLEGPSVWMADPSVSLSLKKYVYRKTKATHPDGSVFFEWDKPRGTKIK